MTDAQAFESEIDDVLLEDVLPIEWEDEIRKKGDWFPRWESCYLVLKQNMLSYYDSSLKTKQRYCGQVAEITKEYCGKPYGFMIACTDGRRMHFSAKSNLLTCVWYQLVSAAITQSPQILSPSTVFQLDLHALYKEYADLIVRKGTFARVLPYFHSSITVTSNYPSTVPVSGEFYGIQQAVQFIGLLQHVVSISDFTLNQILRKGDLAVCSGRETIRNAKTSRKFHQEWTHQLRFAPDGRISHIHILCDEIAATVAFHSGQLKLEMESQPIATSCPAGTVRVQCLGARQLRKHRKIQRLATYAKITLHSISQQTAIQTGTHPNWTKTFEFEYMGHVPGTATRLFIEIYHSNAVTPDELIGECQVNLSHQLSSKKETDIAAIAIPKWYDLKSKKEESTGEIQLGITFVPTSSDDLRQSLDRLDDLTQLVEHSTLETDSTAKHSFVAYGTMFHVNSRYQMIRPVGHGAYGVVVAASDQLSGKSVAIKKITNTFEDLIDAKRIVREIRLMLHLSHPNIISLVDLLPPPSLSEFEDTYIVTDLMETDLHRLIQSKEEISAQHICFIMYQLVCALRYLHSAHVIHRDLKPSNILVNKDCCIKLCDFGLARGTSDERETEKDAMDMTEYVVTRWYRAPELLLASHYTSQIDVWSIGCIMAELFTRKAIFPGHDHVHQLSLITQLLGSPDDLEFVSNPKAKKWQKRQPIYQRQAFEIHFPTIPSAALDLLEKLLVFDPTKRFSIDQVLEHEYFNAFRNPEVESKCPNAFTFSFEKDQLDKETLQKLIYEDICRHFN